MKTLISILICAAGALAQTIPNAVPLPNPEVQFLDQNGRPLAGGFVYTYAAGTTTPIATYTDSSAGTPNANPIILDSAGRASIWIGAAAIKLVVEDANSVTQWTQDNISDTTLYFVNYIKSIGTCTMLTYNPPNGQPQTNCSAELTALTSNPYINAKLNCGAKGDGTTDDGAVLNTCLGNNGIVFLPPGTYCTSVQIAVPGKTQLLGSGRGDSGGPNTVIKACSGFPTYTPVVALCPAVMTCEGSQVENLSIDCNSLIGCSGGRNNSAQEESFFRRVLFVNYSAYGLWIGGTPGGSSTYQAQNSGPYDQLEFLSFGAGTSSTVCVLVDRAITFRGLWNTTCNGDGYASEPLNGIVIDGTWGQVLSVTIQEVQNGFVVGSTDAVGSDVNIFNVECGDAIVTCIHLVPATFGNQNITIAGAHQNQASGNLILDDCNTVTVPYTDGGMALYSIGGGMCGSTQTVLTTSNSIALSIAATATKILRNVTVPGTGASDGSVTLGQGANFKIYRVDTMGGAGNTISSNDASGVTVQQQNMTPGPSGGGLYMQGGGIHASTDPSIGIVGGGVLTDGGTNIAESTGPAWVLFKNGTVTFFCDTGKTPGSSYSPTQCFQLTTVGPIFPAVAFTGLGIQANGTALYCNNCNNVVDDSAVAGAACASTPGHGAFARRENGHWACN